MKKNLLILTLGFLFCCVNIYAEPQKAVVDKQWEKKADVNKNGIVDKAEANKWKKDTKKYKDKNKAETDVNWKKKADVNKDGVVDKVEMDQWKKKHGDKDNNPPGPKGGPGTNWENKPGPQDGPGASPDRAPKKR
jgi:hypothetical protein